MPYGSERARRVAPVFAPDDRSGADLYVYCKGCGQPLEGQPRHAAQGKRISTMMCAPCREFHGHDLVPRSDAPSFCYRCGGEDEVFIEEDIRPITHRVCPRCVPERAERYRAGDFATPVPPPALPQVK
jgi:hypothetical protein